MSAPLVVIGAGGFGREVFDLISDINQNAAVSVWDFVGFVADTQPMDGFTWVTQSWLGPVTDETLSALPSGCKFVVAVGNSAARIDLETRAEACGLQPATLIHPSVIVGRDVEIGTGSIICAGSIITTNVHLGMSTQVNIGCRIGHDNTFGDYVTLSPSVSTAGNVTVGSRSTLFTGVSVMPGISIGDDATVGVGAAVIRDIPGQSTAFGNPARVMIRK